VHIGGRLLVLNGEHRIARLDPAGRSLALRAGFEWDLGKQVSETDLDALGDWMAETLCSAILKPAREIYLTEPLKDLSGIEGVMFSAASASTSMVAKSAISATWPAPRISRTPTSGSRTFAVAAAPRGECIRATAFGASE